MIINFLFKDHAAHIEIGGDFQEFLSDIMNLLPSFLDKDGYRQVTTFSHVSEKLMENIDKIVEKYKKRVIEVYKIRSLFKQYNQGEPFFIIPGAISKEELENLNSYLVTVNDPDPEESRKKLEELKSQISRSYRFIQQSGLVRVSIGEADKSKRVCRYCHKSTPEVTFKQIAHTISEALGNKTIITNTECDECNNRYGTGIEMDCANYHNFIRRFYNIRGKTPLKDGGTNFKIEHTTDGNIKIGITLTDAEISEFERDKKITGKLCFPLHVNQKFRPVNVYKALCKYVLGILDDDDMAPFQSTIDWMDSNLQISPLPKVAVLFPTNFHLNNPRISILIRTSEQEELPYSIGIVEFTDIAYCFIVPIQDDIVNYSDEELWNRIAKALPIYKPQIGWRLKDFSSDIQQDEIRSNLNFVQRSKQEDK